MNAPRNPGTQPADWKDRYFKILFDLDEREKQWTERFGRLQTEGQQVTAFLGKGCAGPGLINGGCYVFPRDELASWPAGRAFSIEDDFFPSQVQSRRFDYFLSEGQFIDIGVPEDYARAQTELAHL